MRGWRGWCSLKGMRRLHVTGWFVLVVALWGCPAEKSQKSGEALPEPGPPLPALDREAVKGATVIAEVHLKFTRGLPCQGPDGICVTPEVRFFEVKRVIKGTLNVPSLVVYMEGRPSTLARLDGLRVHENYVLYLKLSASTLEQSPQEGRSAGVFEVPSEEVLGVEDLTAGGKTD